jgi:serine/threonine protein kinase
MSFICRNIKLENIFLDQNGHCKLGDFWVSRLGIFYGMKTRTFIGAVPYMAPEVIITVYFTCDSCIFCREVLHFYCCYCEFFILYKFIVIFIENIEV